MLILHWNSRKCFFVQSVARSVCLPAALGSTERYSAWFRGHGRSVLVLSTVCLRYYGGSDSCRFPFRGILFRQVSCVHLTTLSKPTATNHTARVFGGLRLSPPKIDPLFRIKTSPLAGRLLLFAMPNRVHFRCGRFGSFRCSPPRLAATQLLPVLIRPTATYGRGLPPRRVVLLRSAPAWGNAPGIHVIPDK